MLDVIIALLPALAVSVYFFGLRSLIMVVISAASSVAFEAAYQLLLKKKVTVGDLSATVTGILIAYNLPVTAPYWVPVVGSLFAIVIAKQLYGGIGKNFMNPALAARAFLLFSFPTMMTTFVRPFSELQLGMNVDAVSAATGVDGITMATPLSYLKNGVLPPESEFSLFQMLIGQVPGTVGETPALVLLFGGLYLLVRRVINARIPLAFIGTVAVITYIFPPEGIDSMQWMLYSLLSGGLILGAVFMATDYSTSPVNPAGQWIFGAGCGILTVIIRYFGAYPEGASYAIILMNCLTWLIDKGTRPRRFGSKFSLFKKRESKGGSK